MRGWFDAFREDGGPTLYAYHNRTPVAADVPALALAAAALTLYLAFLVVFPGIRKERFSTFATVTLSLFVGTVILVCRHGSCWHVARASVPRASYRAYSGERLSVRVAVHVGLDHVNVTLRAIPDGNSTLMSDVDFNEQFAWAAAGAMAAAYGEALRRGLPYPVLTVAEYFALGQEGFDWGGRYRAAGYFATTLLWTCLALWMLMNLLVVVVPRYGAYAMCATGAVLAGTAGGYWALLPRAPLTIVIEGVALTFALGWCFWLVLVAGCICVVSGAVISILDLMYPHRFSTVLEVDYDTPYDRHVLIEDSEDHKKRARPAHAVQSLPTRILRRLSSKTRDSDGEERLDSSTVSIVNESGRDNPAFERERAPPPAPKSPWRYPLFRRQLPHPMDRADSASSFASSCAGAIKMSQLATSPSNIPHRLRPQNPATERVKDMW